MVTRSIVTSHPDVECGFCGRRLLRGEQPEVYLAGSHRRLVCELCAPRAADEGWLREGHDQAPATEPERSGRTRGLFRRRRVRRGEPGSGESRGRRGAYDFMSPLRALQPHHGDGATGSEEAPADPLQWSDDPRGDAGEPWRGAQTDDGWHQAALEGPPAEEEHRAPAEPPAPEVQPAPPEPAAEDILAARALAVFNASEHPKRVSGIARALGAPIVSVRPSGSGGEQVRLTVAWEICWYRYEVDLSNPDPLALLTAEGMELEELPAAERVANAVADERGELALA